MPFYEVLFCFWGVLECVFMLDCYKKHIIFHIFYIITAPLTPVWLNVLFQKYKMCCDWLAGPVCSTCSGNELTKAEVNRTSVL